MSDSLCDKKITEIYHIVSGLLEEPEKVVERVDDSGRVTLQFFFNREHVFDPLPLELCGVPVEYLYADHLAYI